MAVAVQWEADDVCGVMVPSGIHRIAHDVANLRKHVFDQGFVSAKSDPLTKVGCNTHHQALAGAGHPTQLLVLAPALQLCKHGLQLKVSSLLIQQTVVFEVIWNEELGRPEEVEDVAEHVSIPVNEVVLLQAVQDYRLCAIKETTNSGFWKLC